MPGCNHQVTNREHAREGTSLTRPDNGLHLLNLRETDGSLHVHKALVSSYAEMATMLEPFKQAAGTRVDARIPRILQHNVSSNGIVQPPTALSLSLSSISISHSALPLLSLSAVSISQRYLYLTQRCLYLSLISISMSHSALSLLSLSVASLAFAFTQTVSLAFTHTVSLAPLYLIEGCTSFRKSLSENSRYERSTVTAEDTR